jgi:hypothetical protein
MELQLKRTYYAEGTNGALYYGNRLICYTIELPWLKNKRKISCIPEGRYPLVARENPHHHEHLLVCDVEDRDLILLHRANDAKKELQGCIAPVTMLTGRGKGEDSADALERLLRLTYSAFQHSEVVWLQISELKPKQADAVSAPAPVISSSQNVNTCKPQQAA